MVVVQLLASKRDATFPPGELYCILNQVQIAETAEGDGSTDVLR
jgi:hypothetical protein